MPGFTTIDHKTVSDLLVLSPSDPRWASYFERLPRDRQDVYYSSGYAQAAAHLHPHGDILCAVYEQQDFVLYPFLLRELAPVLRPRGIESCSRDVIGIYGRGGAVISAPNSELLTGFHSAFANFARANSILCGFDRYHPIFRNEREASPGTRVIDVGGFVVLDLKKPLDQIERDYKHAVRKNIKKAERAGVTIHSEGGLQRLDEFLAIYEGTMDRNQAASFYYVKRAFYESLARELPGHFRFFYASLNGATVSTELVLLHRDYAHSFLGGTDGAALDACPNHLLKRDIVRWLHASGYRYYLLGGGPTPYDGIWNYKRGFAENGSLASYVGGVVYDEVGYDALKTALNARGFTVPPNRFQFYDAV